MDVVRMAQLSALPVFQASIKTLGDGLCNRKQELHPQLFKSNSLALLR